MIWEPFAVDYKLGLIPDSGEQRAADAIGGRYYSAAPRGDSVVTTSNAKPIPFRDQGVSNFCTRFALLRGAEYALWETLQGSHLSPLFHAWNDAMPGWRGQNEGTQIYRSAEALRQWGCCSEEAVPWERADEDDYLTRLEDQPPQFAFEEARRWQMVSSRRVPDGDAVSVVEAHRDGWTVVFGCPVRTRFEVVDGVLVNEGAIRGYHAMLSVDAVEKHGTQHLRVENSWRTMPHFLVPLSAVREWTDMRVVTGMESVVQ